MVIRPPARFCLVIYLSFPEITLPLQLTGMKPTPAARTTLACAIFCFLHVAAGAAGGLLELNPQQLFWNPSSGLALALLILLGPRFFPVVLAANLVTAFMTPALPFWWLKLLFPVVFTLNYAGMARASGALPGSCPCSVISRTP